MYLKVQSWHEEKKMVVLGNINQDYPKCGDVNNFYASYITLKWAPKLGEVVKQLLVEVGK